MSGGRHRAIAFGFFKHELQAENLIQASSASFSMQKCAFLRAIYEQIRAVRSQIQARLGLFCNSDVKKIPNAIPLGFDTRRLAPVLPRVNVDVCVRTGAFAGSGSSATPQSA